jgi:HIV Tat-specific factor 1
LFDWRPDKLRGERARNENVVVLKRLFKPEEFDVNPAMLLEYQRDLREECAKFGHVKRVVIFDVGFWLYSVWPSQNIN